MPRCRMYGLLKIYAEFFNHRDENGVLILQMLQDDLDFLLRFDVDFKVIVRAKFGMAPLDILADHDQRHQKQLNQIGNEQPKCKCHWRIELQSTWHEQIPRQPHDSPDQDGEKETHGADPLGDPASQAVKGAKILGRFPIHIAEPFAALSKGSQ